MSQNEQRHRLFANHHNAVRLGPVDRPIRSDGPTDELLNDRLKNKQIFLTNLKIVPRRYQNELARKAIEQNTIIYLGTGLGKTYITVLLLNSAQIDEKIQRGFKGVFLAPTQDLIKQQAEYINKHVRYRIKIFCGRTARCGRHIDHWDKDIWQSELQQVDLLFMTPQIFCNAMSTSLLEWPEFAVVIFDEFHHACPSKNKGPGSAYLQTLMSYERFYSLADRSCLPRPRMVGLTASLINSMPKNREDITKQVKQLEDLIHGKCFTDIEVQESKPTMILHRFSGQQISQDNDILTSMLTRIAKNLNEVLKIQKAENIRARNQRHLTKDQAKILSFYNRLRLASMGFSIKPSSFPKVLEGMVAIRQRCGLWHLRAICSLLIGAIEKHGENSLLNAEIKPIYTSFAQILRKIHNSLDIYLMNQPNNGILSHARPKSKALLDVLSKEFERVKDKSSAKTTFGCIVFVRSRLEVVATNKWLQEISLRDEYSFIKSDYAIGLAATMSSKYACITKRKPAEQSSMLNKFRDHSLNVIVTTSVLEEGIDLPVCSTVIRYDSPNNFREYVQSRGRARQTVSNYVSLCALEMTIKMKETLDKFNDFEVTLKNRLCNQDIAHSVRQEASTREKEREFDIDLDTDDFFLARDDSVRISSSTAKTILNMYCNRLAKNTPFTEGVRFDRVTTEKTFQTILYLPSGCPLNNGIKGRPKSSRELSDSSAAVAAVKALYEANELDERGVPTRVSDKNIDKLLETQDLRPNIEPLDESLEGQKLMENGRELSFFIPRLLQSKNPLHKDCANRTYKLLRIRFKAYPDKAREETRTFFEQSVYGLIVDSNTANDFVPASLFGHYGKFGVEFLQVHENWSITASKDHRDYLDYTFKFITRCLSIRGLNKDSFRDHCIFYLLPLDNLNQPDYQKMRSSFGTFQHPQFQEGGIVKLRHIYRQMVDHNPRQRRSNDTDRPMLVRGIRHDMNAKSLIKIRGRTTTLFQNAEESYGRGVVSSYNQLVIECMPLSKEFASAQEVATRKTEFSSDSMFYLAQFLETFDSDAATVFQAFLMPEIIHRLYLNSIAHELDREFRIESEIRRNDDCPPKLSKTNELTLDRKDLGEFEPEEAEQDRTLDEEKEEFVEFPENYEPDNESDGDSESITNSESSNQSSHSDYDDDLNDIMPSYENLIMQETLNLDNDDNQENMKRWDLRQYSVANLNTLDYETQDSIDVDALTGYSAQNAAEFLTLELEVNSMQSRLLDQLKAIEFSLTGDAWDLDEDSELQKRTAKVDRTIEPSVRFDRSRGFLGPQTHLKGVLEALTLRRAGHGHNLEGLENIGDSYLKYVVSVILFKRLEGNEGLLTSARSRLTCNELFCYLAKKRRLGSYAITGIVNKKSMHHLFGLGWKEEERQSVSNRMRPKDLADLFESLVGAYLLYKGEFEAILAIEWLGLDIFKEGTFDELHKDSVVFSKAPTALVESCDSESKKYYERCKVKYSKFEEIIGYKFNDASYLVQAFTHASALYKCTRSYERLEFLGDAILDFTTLQTLVNDGCKFSPGQLSSSKSCLVNNYNFARLAMHYKYDLFIMHGNCEIHDELAKVRFAMEEDPKMDFVDMINFDRIVKLLADVYESVAGAIYLDSGNSLDTVWSVYYPMMKQYIDEEIRSPTKNIVQRLYELFPGTDRIIFDTYDLKTSEGDEVGVKCTITGFGEFEGRGLSRNQAKQRAICEAMRQPPSPEMRARLDAEYRAKTGGGVRQSGRSYRGSSSRGRQHHNRGRPSNRGRRF